MPHDANVRPITLSRSPWGPTTTLLAGLGLAAGMAAPAGAAITWNGGNGDGDFASPANWNGTDPDTGNDGTLEDGDLIFAGNVQTSVVVDIDYSGIDSIVFAGDADTFTINGDVDGNTENLTFTSGASIINNSTQAGNMTFGAGLNLIFSGSSASITNNDANGDSAIIVNSTMNLAGSGSFILDVGGVGATQLNGVISGAGARLDKDGTGTLTLGAANTFTGGVRLGGGTLLVGNAASMGTGSLTVVGNSTLGATGGAISNIANNVVIASGVALTIGGSESIEFDGTFGGTGNLVINVDDVSDVVTLNGSLANLSGDMTFTEGTLIAGTSASLVGSGSRITVDAVDDEFSLRAGAAGLSFAPDIIIQRSGGTAELGLDGSNGFALNGAISGNGRIEIGVDAGQFITLGSANTFTGGVTIDTAGAGVILGHRTSLGTGALTLATSGVLQAATDLGEIANAVALGANTLTISGANDLELAGVISGTGAVTVNAAGATVELSGTNTYTGATTLTAGTLLFGSNDAIGNGGGGASLAIGGGTIGVGAGGLNITLDEAVTVTGDFGVADLGGGSLTLAGTVQLSAPHTLTTNNDELFTISGVLSSVGQDDALTKAGTGMLVLSGDNNAWNGGVQLGAGSLGIGHDNALGSAALDVTGNATIFGSGGARTIANAIDLNSNALVIGGAENLTLTGAMTSSGGGGDVTYAGSGTVTVGNAGSSYAGTTTFSSGTVLATNANAFGSSTLNLAGGTLGASGGLVTLTQGVTVSAASTITGDENIIFSGAVAGSQMITVDMSDVATYFGLAGTNTFSGPVNVVSGSLLVGNGAALADSTIVTVADSADAGFILLAGETIGGLSGGGTAGGNTILNANTLTLAGSGSTVFNYDGVIGGTGGLTVTGGSHYLGGTSTFTGATAVNGGLLGGSGGVGGDLSVASGATLAPGSTSATGQFTVGGNLNLAAGSTLQIMIDGTDPSNVSSVHATGTATIGSGANLNVSIGQVAGTYIASNSTYQVLSADGGIGTPDFTINADSATLAFYNLADFGLATYTPGDTTLSLIATRATGAYSNPDIIDPGNNRRVGTALDTITAVADAAPTGDAADLLAQLQGLNAADLNAALQGLAPVAANVSTSIAIGGVSAYSSVQSSYLAARRDGTEDAFMTAGGRLAMGGFGLATAESLLGGGGATGATDASILAGMLQNGTVATDAGAGSGGGGDGGGELWKVFAKVYGVMSDQDADGNRVGFDGSFVGVQGGIDRRFGDEWVAGLGIGYLASDVDLEPGRGDLEADTFRIGPYASWTRDEWFVDMSASVGFGSYDQNRLVTIPMMATQTARGSYDGTDISLLLAGGRDYTLENSWTLTPQAAIQWSTYDFDGYTETGAGVNNTTISDRSADSLRGRLALGLSREFALDSGTVVTPEFLIGWEHEFMDFDDVEARFAVGGDAFLLDVGSPVEDGLVVGAGATVEFSPRFSGFVRYDGVYGDGSTTHAISGGIQLEF
jgi:outer membrane autotransporter protein